MYLDICINLYIYFLYILYVLYFLYIIYIIYILYIYFYYRQWYDCIISKYKGDSFLITYIGYNNSEYVSTDQVRIKKKKKIKEIITPAGYKLPENLIIKEGDSLKVKMAKKKKRIALKKKQKDEIMDKEFSNKSKQWRSFHEKAISKSKHLLVSTKRVENIENKNNQSNFNIRRKFDYNDNEE